MKKIVLLFAFLCTMAFSATAQEIFKEVNSIMDKQEAIKKDTKRGLEERKIATFKSDAIFYMIMKAKDTSNFSERQLGQQVDAMLEYVNTYVKRLANIQKKTDRDILMARYKNATTRNPLFNDTEKEVVYAYVDNNNFITQFSIDTDWVKALQEVKQ